MTNGRYIVALLLAALSGCAALAHELLWTRRLIDLLGASAESSARVFECFFLGLALGAAWSTRLTRRVRRPWRAVAVIELGIALLVLPAVTLPSWTGWVWPWLGPARLINWPGWTAKLAISVAVVMPPAFMMGMTLPLMARAILRGNHRLERQGVWLYAVNTAGGVAGLMITATVALHTLGVMGSMIAAMALNLIVAGCCAVLDRADDEQEPVPPPADHASPTPQIRLPLTVLLLAFMSGAGVLGIEVLLMHLFLQVVPTAIHAVNAVLASVILLLAVSAALVPVLVPRLDTPRGLLAPVLAGTGLATAVTPLLFMWVTGGMITVKPSTGVVLFSLKMASYVLLASGPCLLFAGLVLPLAFAWFGSECGDAYGRRWGWILAVNGVGGIIGAEAAQRIVMPMFGMHGALGVYGFGYALLGIFVVFANDRWRALRGPVWRYAGVAVIILAIGVGWLIRLPLIHPSPTKDIQFKTLWLRAGPEGVVAVTDSKALGRGIVMFNQYVLGSTKALGDEQRQAHLPILLHPQPRDVAFIGLATGITAGAALMHSDVESVTAIELSPLVTAACRERFADVNGGIFTDPRATVVVEDGRTYIASCQERFDVVASDLFLPWRQGVGRLYSLEHFRAVHRSLRAGGLFCQMLPMYQLSREQLDVILATLLEVFPEAHLFRLGFDPEAPPMAIVAYKDSRLNWDAVSANCNAVRSRGVIRDLSVRHAEGMKMLYMGSIDPSDLDGVPINTLGNAWVELDAGVGGITGAWERDYFIKGNRWLAFEVERIETLAATAGVDHELIRLSLLGSQLSQWVWTKRNGVYVPDQLSREIIHGLPESMKTDREADSPVWRK